MAARKELEKLTLETHRAKVITGCLQVHIVVEDSILNQLLTTITLHSHLTGHFFCYD